MGLRGTGWADDRDLNHGLGVQGRHLDRIADRYELKKYRMLRHVHRLIGRPTLGCVTTRIASCDPGAKMSGRLSCGRQSGVVAGWFKRVKRTSVPSSGLLMIRSSPP